MALSIVTIPGDGVTDTFTVSFALGILDRNSVTAWVTGEVDGGGNKVYRTITYLSDTMLKISGPKAGVGVPVVFTRTTPNNSLIVNYEDGDIMNETNLNTAQKQALMLVHQVLDGRFSAFIQDVSAGGFKITNLGTPIASTDAANKAYVDGLISTGQASASAAAASASAALASQNAAATSAGNAATSATNANQSKIDAQAANVSAYNNYQLALTYSNNALTYSQTAQAWATNAEDVPVSGGLYSAYHWARKAMAYVAGNLGAAINGMTAKNVPAVADKFMMADSADSFNAKSIDWNAIITAIFGSARTFISNLTVNGIFSVGSGSAGRFDIAGPAIEMGAGRSVDGPSYIDMHTAAPGTSDWEFRLIRNAGVNGAAQLSQTGTGGIDISATASGDVRITGANFTWGGANVLTEGRDALLGQGVGVGGTFFPKGNQSGLTYTVTYTDGNFPYLLNNGAFTIAMETSATTAYWVSAWVVNQAGAGNITFSNLTRAPLGDALDTTVGSSFLLHFFKFGGERMVFVVKVA